MKLVHGLFLLLFSFLYFNTLAQQNYTDSILSVIQNNASEINRAAARLILAEKVAQQYPDSARNLIEKSENLLLQPENYLKAEYYNTYALLYWYSDDHENAIALYRQTMALEDDPKVMPKKSKAANNIGTLYSMVSEFDSAKKYLEISVAIDLETNNMRGVTKSYYDLGVLYKRLDKYEISLGYYLKVLDYQEKTRDTLRLIYTLNAIGNIYYLLDNPGRASQAYFRAVELDERYEKINQLFQTYNNLTALYLEKQNNIDSVLYFGNKGLANLPERFSDNQITLHINLSNAYRALKLSDRENFHISTAFSMRNMTKSQIIQSAVYSSMASHHLHRGQIDSAYYYSNLAKKLANDANSMTWQKNNYLIISKIDSASGNFKEAYNNFKEGSIIEQKILNLERITKFAELDIIYETKKKDAEYDLLRQKNELNEQIIRNQRLMMWLTVSAILFFILFVANQYFSKKRLVRKNREILAQQQIIEEKNKMLTELNQTKDKFFSIISHDLRGPFNSLLPLLSAIIDDYHEISEEEKLSILKSIRKSSENTYNLLVNLLEWSRAQRDMIKPNIEIFNLVQIIDEVFDVLHSRAHQKNHTLINSIDPEQLIETDRQLLSNILINLINNSIKFTPPNGRIIVECRNDDKKVFISVSDNGIGIPEDKLDQLFRLDSNFNRHGTDNEMGTGLGLILVKEFVGLLGGSLQIKTLSKDNSAEKGSRFTIQLPVHSFLV